MLQIVEQRWSIWADSYLPNGVTAATDFSLHDVEVSNKRSKWLVCYLALALNCGPMIINTFLDTRWHQVEKVVAYDWAY